MPAPKVPRIPLFIACEGESELGYARFFGGIIGSAFHVDAAVCHGGDPVAVVQATLKALRNPSRRGVRFAAKAVFVDTDLCRQRPDLAHNANRIAEAHGLTMLWQVPCHEAFLLRHLEGCAALRPPTSELAMAALVERWPDYRKGTSAAVHAHRLDDAAVRRALSVEPAFDAWVRAAGGLGIRPGP